MNSATPLLTVVVPVFNTDEVLLKRCFSALPFGDDRRFEAVVVDDGSNEETKRRLFDYAVIYGAHFNLFRQENMGQSAARRLGVRLAQGKYVMFLDSDDYVDTSAFVSLLNVLQTDSPDILGFNYEEVDEEGRTVRAFKRFDQPYADWDKRDLICTSCSLWGQVYRKGLVLEYLESAPDDLRIGEDLSVAVPVAVVARMQKGAALNVYRYVQHADSISHKVDERYVFDIIKAFSHAIGQLTPDSRHDFKDELEWICILHVLIYGSTRAIRCFGSKRSCYVKLLSFVSSMYPSWKSNKYLMAQQYVRFSDVRLAMNGHWRTYVAKKRLKDVFSELRRRA